MRKRKRVSRINLKPSKLDIAVEPYLASDEHIRILLRTGNGIDAIRRCLSYNMITQQQMVELTKVSASTAHVAIMSGRVDYTQPFLHRKDKERRKYGPKFIVVNDKFWDYVKLMWDKYS